MPRLFWGILTATVVLAAVYAAVTPPFEKPDENWHFAVAMYLVDHGGLPQNTAPSPDHYAAHQANQPPLYYLTLASLWRVLGLHELTPGYLTLAQANEQFQVRESPFPSDNMRLFVEGRCQDVCARARQALIIGRALSALYVGLGLVFAARAVRRLFPEDDALLLMTAALIGLNPQVLHIGTSLSNDSLVLLLLSLGFWLAARWLDGARSRRMVIAMGVVAGAALLTKLSAAPLGVALGLLLLSAPTRRRDLLLMGGAAGIVSGWWFAFNTILYGDPTALNAHLRLAPQAGAARTLAELVYQLRAVVRSYWAEFGWGQVVLPEDVYTVIVIATLGSMLAGVVVLARRWRSLRREQRAFLLMAGAVLVLTVGLLIRWMTTTQAPHGRLLFPAVLPIALLMAAGLTGWVPASGRVRWRALAAGLIIIGLLVFAALMPVRVIQPAYEAPEPVIDPQPGPTLAVFTEGGGGAVSLRDVVLVDAPGWLVVQLTWQVEAPLRADYLVFVHALDAAGAIIAQRDSYPGLSNRPFTRVEAGGLLHDVYPLARPDGPVAALRIGLYRSGEAPGTWQRLAATSERFTVADGALTIPRESLRLAAVGALD